MTIYHDDGPICRVEALQVACPICDSPAGHACCDIDGAMLIDRPHGYRVVVAAEEAIR